MSFLDCGETSFHVFEISPQSRNDRRLKITLIKDIIKMKKGTRNLLITISISMLILLTIAIFAADKIQIGITHY